VIRLPGLPVIVLILLACLGVDMAMPQHPGAFYLGAGAPSDVRDAPATSAATVIAAAASAPRALDRDDTGRVSAVHAQVVRLVSRRFHPSLRPTMSLAHAAIESTQTASPDDD